jgi:hypothetical protein
MCPICESLVQELSRKRFNYLLCRAFLFQSPEGQQFEALTQLHEAEFDLRGVEQVRRQHATEHSFGRAA